MKKGSYFILKALPSNGKKLLPNLRDKHMVWICFFLANNCLADKNKLSKCEDEHYTKLTFRSGEVTNYPIMRLFV